MKTIIAAGVVLALLSGNALAQTPPQPAPMGEDHSEADHAMQPSGPPHGMMGEHGRPHGPERSARFRLQVGDIFLGLTCPDDEPMKACEDFAMQLLDKAGSIERR